MAPSCSFKITAVLLVVAVASTTPEKAMAEFVLGEPVNLGAPMNTSADDWGITIASDGLTAYVGSTRSGGFGSDDLWMVTRAAPDAPWGEPINLGSTVNTGASEGYPSISADGLTLFFSEVFGSTASRPLRTGGLGGQDLWMTTRPTIDSEWGAPVNLGSVVNTAADERSPCISADGLELYFASNRAGGSGTLDLWVSRRSDTGSSWTAPVNLGPAVNWSDDDADPSICPDGLTLLFASWGRPGGYGSHDLYVSTRTSVDEPWGPAVNLGPALNGSTADGGPFFRADTSTLFFLRYGAGGLGGVDLWQVPVTVTVDLTGDGQVDGDDVRVVGELWDQDAPLADIAPSPFGDGTVDVLDLLVLADHIGDSVVDSTLLAYWPLDEVQGRVAHDAVDAEHDGVMVSEAAWRPEGGMVGGGLALDGIDDFVGTGFVRDPASGPFSVLLWIKDGLPGQGVVSQTNGPTWLETAHPDGTLATGLQASGRTATTLQSATIVTDGAWHRVAFVWDGIHRILYVDGAEAARDSVSDLASSSGRLNLGAGGSFVPGTFWSGLIDDVRIYDRAVKP